MAQSKELLERIDRDHTLRRLLYEKKYDSIIAIAGKLPFRDSLYLYGTEGYMAYALLAKGDTNKAILYISKAIENQSIKSLENLKYEYEHYNLSNNKAYQELVKNFDKLFSKYTGTLNLSMLQDCLEIYYTDSRTRRLAMMAEPGSTKQLYADSLQYQSDMMNVEAMKKIMRTYKRFPGISDVGSAFHSNFKHILGHFAYLLPQDTLVAYLKTATLKGEVPNIYGPFLIDKRLSGYNKGLQLYGEFGNHADYVGDVYHYRDIADIENVDKRRTEFLLLPLYKMQETQKCVLPKGYRW